MDAAWEDLLTLSGLDQLDELLDLLDEAPVDLGPWSLDTEEPQHEYAAMLLSAQPGPRSAWLWEASLLMIIGRGPEDEALLVDLEPDHLGQHRIYCAKAEGGVPDLYFRELSELIKWVQAGEGNEPPRCEMDEWSLDPASVEQVYPLLQVLHPALIWAAYGEGSWIEAVDGLPEVVSERAGARRIALLSTLGVFVATKKVSMPASLPLDELSGAHLALRSQLDELAEAMVANDVPMSVADAALSADPAIAEVALRYMAEFGEQPEKPAAPSKERSQTEELLNRIKATTAEMIETEVLEIEKEQIEKLNEDLFEVAMKALTNSTRPPQLLRSLTERLVDSKRIEDVFAADEDLSAIFAKNLGLS